MNLLDIIFADCNLSGQVIKHGTLQYVQVYELSYCFQCACLFGELKCKFKFKIKIRKGSTKWITHECNGQIECRNLTNHSDVKNCKSLYVISCSLNENIMKIRTLRNIDEFQIYIAEDIKFILKYMYFFLTASLRD